MNESTMEVHVTPSLSTTMFKWRAAVKLNDIIYRDELFWGTQEVTLDEAIRYYNLVMEKDNE